MIPPSMIYAMLRNPDDTTSSSPPTTDGRTPAEMERAMAQMENAIQKAAVVTMDQETTLEEGPSADHQDASSSSRISCLHGAWMFLQLVYSTCMILFGIMFSCNDVDTLRAWSIVWGLLTLHANVVMPLRGYNPHSRSTGSGLFTAFILLYIWGSSAVFPHWGTIDDDEEEEGCHLQLFWWSAWSVVCGMGVTLLMLLAGMSMRVRQKGTPPVTCVRDSSQEITPTSSNPPNARPSSDVSSTMAPPRRNSPPNSRTIILPLFLCTLALGLPPPSMARLSSTVTDNKDVPTSTLLNPHHLTSPSNVSFCERIHPEDLPEECTCTEPFPYSLVLNCVKPFNSTMFNDTIGLEIIISPCDPEGASVSIDVTERNYNIEYPISGIRADEEQDYPIPGLAIIVPGLGHVGLDVAVLVSGNLDSLTLKIGLNACIALAQRTICASSIPGVNQILPWYVLSGTYKFGDACSGNTTTTTTTDVASAGAVPI